MSAGHALVAVGSQGRRSCLSLSSVVSRADSMKYSIEDGLLDAMMVVGGATCLVAMFGAAVSMSDSWEAAAAFLHGHSSLPAVERFTGCTPIVLSQDFTLAVSSLASLSGFAIYQYGFVVSERRRCQGKFTANQSLLPTTVVADSRDAERLAGRGRVLRSALLRASRNEYQERQPKPKHTMKNTTTVMLVIALAALLIAATPANAGGRYPVYISKIHGDVQIRLDKPGSRWHKPKLGSLMGGPYLLRTGPHSYAHLNRTFRCVDFDSLIRINEDSEATIDVLRGQMSAVDGKRGKSLPDDVR